MTQLVDTRQFIPYSKGAPWGPVTYVDRPVEEIRKRAEECRRQQSARFVEISFDKPPQAT